MPLARIITNAVEESLELTIQLRTRGFHVETVAPGKIPANPADLEIRLDECDSADVTSRVCESDSSENLWVYFAPGALDELAGPVRVIPLIPPLEKDHPSPAAKPKTVLSFHPEDDPILAELESDVILSETAAASSQDSAAVPLRVDALTSAQNDRAKRLSPSDPIPAVVGIPAALPEKAIESGPAIAKAPRDCEFRIPRVPERPSLLLGVVSTASSRRPRPIVRIGLQTGPRFWRKAFASGALVVLGTAVALIVGMRPPLPAVAVPPASGRSQSFAFTQEHPANVVHPTAAMKAKSVLVNPQTSASSVVKRAAQVSKDDPPKQAPRVHSAHADDMVAKDTVVFYDRPHSRTSKAIPQSRPRRYSDLN